MHTPLPQNFFEQVYEIVARIPYGKVISYGEIAVMLELEDPQAARDVGYAMRVCPEELPWQRVVMADGSVSGGDTAEIRQKRLREEGVRFLPDGRVNMKICSWMSPEAYEEDPQLSLFDDTFFSSSSPE